MGKSTIATNLAATLVTDGKRTLLLDADLDTPPSFVAILEQMKDFNPLLRVRAVFTQVSTHPQDFRQSQAQEILADYPEITVLETRVHQKAAFMDTMPTGLSVIEWSDPKAEIEELTQEVIFHAS